MRKYKLKFLKLYKLQRLSDSRAFIENSNDMDDIYKNIEEYNRNKKRKILIAFDYTIVDMLSNKKLNPVVTELFIRGGKLNISLAFITQCYFAVLKNIRLNSTHYFVMKVSNKRGVQKIAFNHSSDIDFQKVCWLYKNCSTKPPSFWLLILPLLQITLQVSKRIFSNVF